MIYYRPLPLQQQHYPPQQRPQQLEQQLVQLQQQLLQDPQQQPQQLPLQQLHQMLTMVSWEVKEGGKSLCKTKTMRELIIGQFPMYTWWVKVQTLITYVTLTHFSTYRLDG